MTRNQARIITFDKEGRLEARTYRSPHIEETLSAAKYLEFSGAATVAVELRDASA